MRVQVADKLRAMRRELDRLIADQDPLVGRVMDNELERYGNIGRPSYGGRPKQEKREASPVVSASASVFDQSKVAVRHPLDRKFRCGFDPQNVSVKQYRLHIANCKDGECIGRHLRWLDLMEYFRK